MPPKIEQWTIQKLNNALDKAIEEEAKINNVSVQSTQKNKKRNWKISIK